MERTLEQNLFEEVIKKLQERRKQQVEYISASILDREDYVQRVGSIRAYDEIEEDFKALHKAFFPDTPT